MTKRLACIGDSLTWGFTLVDPLRESYPARLQGLLGADFIVRNFGCNGASVRADSYSPYTDTTAFRTSLAWAPDIVLLMLGSNDCVQQAWDSDAFCRDYERLVSAYRDLPSQPRLILIAPIRMFRVMGFTFMDLSPEILEQGVRPTIRAIAADQGLACIDLVDVIRDASYCYDGVHPQTEGTRLMAEAIYERVQW